MKNNLSININVSIINNVELYNAIVGAKKIIDNYVKDFSFLDTANFNGYQKVYISTNERLKDYLDLLDLRDKNSALSVTSSGDHAFNLITKGILNVDTFDSNILTEYFVFGLKRAMIIKYDYKTYLNTLRTFCNRTCKCETITEIIFDLLPLMDEKYRIFWKEVIDYNNLIQKEYGLNTNIISIICMGFNKISFFTDNNNYLENEDKFNRLKNNLLISNITFTHANAKDLVKKFTDKKYDIVLLSNILDYFSHNWGFDWSIDKLDEYTEILSKLINDKGMILLNYIYSYKYLTPAYYYKKSNTVIRNSKIKYDELDEYEILELPPIESNDIPALLLKRVQ